ncbi:hypothetical protein [Pseudomonas boanensis]|uniref:hypothetical protein n=1 Tax=Metapseudomonas boanensis TaxID=2822138 RepID=UPI0035D3E0A4
MDDSIKRRVLTATLWALWWLLVGSASVWLLAGSVAYWAKTGWLPADTSGWVQAIGGLLAIGVALMIPFIQRAQNKDRQRQDEIQAAIRKTGLALQLSEETEILISLFVARRTFQSPRIPWHDAEYYRTRLGMLQSRIGGLLGDDYHLLRWGVFLNLQTAIHELESSLRVVPIDDPVHVRNAESVLSYVTESKGWANDVLNNLVKLNGNRMDETL